MWSSRLSYVGSYTSLQPAGCSNHIEETALVRLTKLAWCGCFHPDWVMILDSSRALWLWYPYWWEPATLAAGDQSLPLTGMVSTAVIFVDTIHICTSLSLSLCSQWCTFGSSDQVKPCGWPPFVDRDCDSGPLHWGNQETGKTKQISF